MSFNRVFRYATRLARGGRIERGDFIVEGTTLYRGGKALKLADFFEAAVVAAALRSEGVTWL